MSAAEAYRLGKESLQISAGRLAYRRVGVRRPERVLLLHGLPTSGYLWRHALPALSRRFDTVALDLLGFGDSDKPAGARYSLLDQAERVREFLHELHWNDCAVVGHDIGGGVAALLAARHPDAASRLVLVDTACYDNFPVPEVARLKEPEWDILLATRELDAGFRKSFERGMVARQLSEEDLREYARPFAGLEGRKAYLRVARDIDNAEWMRERSRVEHYPGHALVLWGDRDAFLPPATGERLAAAMKDARFEALADCGHYAPEDRPEELTRRLVEFLS